MSMIVLTIFILGYLLIAFEQSVKINKAATALITGVACWTVYFIFSDKSSPASDQLGHLFGEVAQIVFFLLAAMAIVELIDAHGGFEIVTKRIRTKNKVKLSWIIAILSFFLSAIIDNLTTAIVMMTITRKLVEEKNDRWVLAGLIIISANAGGAWSPIGDVTTTMLWIGGQITALNIIVKLIVPSLFCMIVPLLIMNLRFKGNFSTSHEPTPDTRDSKDGRIIFFTGIIIFLLVPVFKTLTGLPPVMGIMAGLGVMWLVTELVHHQKNEEERTPYSVAHALQRIDTPSILFFLGILLAVGALQATGQLSGMATWMDEKIGNESAIGLSIGALSSIVDNVPLLAATQGMYGSAYPTDHYFWEFIAYTTGTGGSMLIIGSAAGVAIMGIEKISFGWYLKKIGWLAALGYLTGAGVYIMLNL